jgi:hypothetical protein
MRNGTNGFQIYGDVAWDECYASAVANVRPGGTGKPEIMITCGGGATGYGVIYGLYENSRWPMVRDLHDLY